MLTSASFLDLYSLRLFLPLLSVFCLLFRACDELHAGMNNGVATFTDTHLDIQKFWQTQQMTDFIMIRIRSKYTGKVIHFLTQLTLMEKLFLFYKMR